MTDSRDVFDAQTRRNRDRFGAEAFPGEQPGQWPSYPGEVYLLTDRQVREAKFKLDGGVMVNTEPVHIPGFRGPDPVAVFLDEAAALELPPVDDEPLWEG